MRDADVRVALLHDLELAHATEPDTLIVEELGLCERTSRIDVAVINGSLNGYEIKSERDTLERLPRQIATYNQVFDTITIVTHGSHLSGVRNMVPSWWGIVEARQSPAGVVLRKVRAPRMNRTTDAYALVQLLWRAEVLNELERRGIAKGLRSKRREEMWFRLSTATSVAELNALVRRTLKQRSSWRDPAPRT